MHKNILRGPKTPSIQFRRRNHSGRSDLLIIPLVLTMHYPHLFRLIKQKCVCQLILVKFCLCIRDLYIKNFFLPFVLSDFVLEIVSKDASRGHMLRYKSLVILAIYSARTDFYYQFKCILNDVGNA